MTEPAPLRTSWLAAAIDEVAEALRDTTRIDAFEVIPYIPERIVPPCALISFGSPMLTDGDTYGDELLRLNIDLLPRAAINETETSDLITMVEDAVPALIELGYGIEQVGQPYMLTANNAQYLATTLQVVGAVRPRKEETA